MQNRQTDYFIDPLWRYYQENWHLHNTTHSTVDDEEVPDATPMQKNIDTH